MSCGEMLKHEALKFSSILLDYAMGVVITITFICIMIYLFGVDGKVTRKTYYPLLVFLTVTVVWTLVIFNYEYVILSKDWSAPFEETMLSVSMEDVPNNFFRIIFYITIFWAGMLTYEKKRIKDSILTVVFTIVFIGYTMIETIFSVIFFYDDPRKKIRIVFDENQFVGSKFGLVLELVIMMIVIFIYIAIYLGMIKKDRKVYVEWKYRLLFIFWELMMFGLIFMPVRQGLSDYEYENTIRYELGVLLPVMGLVIPVIFIAIISRRYVIKKTEVQENYISAELDYLNQYKKEQNETRTFRHDIMTKLSTLSAMYREKNYDEAGRNLRALLGNVRAMSPKYVTGDEMLDCIVGMKSSKMEEDGIEFFMDGVLDGGLGMKPVDICVIFANAFDNAIEACEGIPENGKRWIKLSMKKTERFFSIVLSNTMYRKEETGITAVLFGTDERVTTKHDRSLHGFGTQNMKATISKYDGIEKASSKDGIFTLSVIIPRSVQSVV